MTRIQGRLHLCTKSIVFEPTDTSRGVIRFPFDKMTITPTLDAGSGATNTIRNSAPGSAYTTHLKILPYFIHFWIHSALP